MWDGRVPLLNIKVIVLWDVKPFSIMDTSVLAECALSIFRLKWKNLLNLQVYMRGHSPCSCSL
jgi:hypothetical protein